MKKKCLSWKAFLNKFSIGRKDVLSPPRVGTVLTLFKMKVVIGGLVFEVIWVFCRKRGGELLQAQRWGMLPEWMRAQVERKEHVRPFFPSVGQCTESREQSFDTKVKSCPFGATWPRFSSTPSLTSCVGGRLI